MESTKSPLVPLLYFSDKGEPLRIIATTSVVSDDDDDDDEQASALELPAEILSKCVSAYADWGDLAKMACVQKSWSNLMYDAACVGKDSKWELSQKLLFGTNGLSSNPSQAVKLLHELAMVPVDGDNIPIWETLGHEAAGDSSADSNEHKTKDFHAPAMKLLASCYLEGKSGLPANTAAGLAWLASAYTYGGDVDAAHDLALVYEYGRFGVSIDFDEAVVWLNKAAEGGHVEAMAELGLCYELGCCGVEQSDEKALDWYMKAAEQGHLTAKFSIGEAYEEARGVPQSDEEACLWYYRAAVEGDEDSREALRRLHDIARIVVPGVGALLNA